MEWRRIYSQVLYREEKMTLCTVSSSIHRSSCLEKMASGDFCGSCAGARNLNSDWSKFSTQSACAPKVWVLIGQVGIVLKQKNLEFISPTINFLGNDKEPSQTTMTLCFVHKMATLAQRPPQTFKAISSFQC